MTSQFVLDHSTSEHPAFLITSVDRAGTTVLSVHGDLDQMTVHQFADTVDDTLAGGLSALIVDLTETRFLGSAGMAALLTAKEQAQTFGVTYAVAADGPATARPMHVVGLATEFAIHPMVEHALQAPRTTRSEGARS